MDVRDARMKAGLTQTELAEKIGVVRSTVSAIENGQNTLTVANAKKIADVLEVDWKLFFE